MDLCILIFKDVLAHTSLGQQKLIFCFAGTGALVFSPQLKDFYSKNRAHNFVKLLCSESTWQNFFD